MQTITIRVHDSVYEKVKALLAKFTKEELELVEDDFDQIRRELHETLARVERGEEKTYTMEEIEVLTEETIRKYDG